MLNRALRHNIRNQMNVVITHATALQDIDDPNYRTAAETIESVSQKVINPIPEGVIRTVQRGTEDPLQHNDGPGLWIVQWVTDTVRRELDFEQRENGSGNSVSLTFEMLNESSAEE